MAQQLAGGRLVDAETGGGKGLGVDKDQRWQLAGVTDQEEARGTTQQRGELDKCDLVGLITDEEIARHGPRSSQHGQLGNRAHCDRWAIPGAEVEAACPQRDGLRVQVGRERAVLSHQEPEALGGISSEEPTDKSEDLLSSRTDDGDL
jgi:hypothetical protein